MPQSKPKAFRPCKCGPVYNQFARGWSRCRDPKCPWNLKNNPLCRCGHTYNQHNRTLGTLPDAVRMCGAMMPGYDRQAAIRQAASDIVKSTRAGHSGQISAETLKSWCHCIKFTRPGKTTSDPDRVRRQQKVHERLQQLREANRVTTTQR